MLGDVDGPSSSATVTKPTYLNATEKDESAATGRNSDVVFCPIRPLPDDTLENITLYLSVYIPTVVGPLFSTVVLLFSLPFLRGCDRCMRNFCSKVLLPGLVLLHLGAYCTHLILVEKLPLEEFYFLVVKYCGGFAHIILVPLLVIATQKDIRNGVRKTFKSTVICKMKTEPDKK